MPVIAGDGCPDRDPETGACRCQKRVHDWPELITPGAIAGLDPNAPLRVIGLDGREIAGAIAHTRVSDDGLFVEVEFTGRGLGKHGEDLDDLPGLSFGFRLPTRPDGE